MTLVVAFFPLFVFAGNAGERPEQASSQDAMFGDLPVVEAASLHVQTLEEAPANVTIVTRDDIRKYGYRTLGEALASVRGFFMSSDRAYQYAGVRGLSLLGDYNTRFLVMLNGHPLTDQVYHANGFFGQDLGIDLDLVSRIEVIRGPTSALYGSNGILANINIVTRSPVDCDRLRVSPEVGSFGEKKIGVASSVYLGRGANLLVSASTFYNDGALLRFPGVPAKVEGVDGEKGYHSFANLVWRDWSFTAYFNDRVKQTPVPWGTGVLFQRGDSVRDSRNFILASHSRPLGPGRLRLQLYYDQYKYNDRFYYPRDSSEDLDDTRTVARGDSVGSQLSWQTEVNRIGELTVGVQLDGDIQNLQRTYVQPDEPLSPDISQPDLTTAFFAQQQWKLSRTITLYGGGRLDHSRSFGASLSPRVALVYQPSPKAVYKAVYGRPFRNPSAYEQYYTDGGVTMLAGNRLEPETAQTLEVSMERKIRPGFSLIVNAYDYELNRLIQADFLPGDIQIFQNSGRYRSKGVEFEVNAKVGRLETAAGYSFQRASHSHDRDPDNLPRSIGMFRAAAPFMRGRLWLSGAFQSMSGRLTLSGTRTRPVANGDVTLSTNRLHPAFDLAAGIRNLANWRYSHPSGLALDEMPANGRSFFVKLIYRWRE